MTQPTPAGDRPLGSGVSGDSAPRLRGHWLVIARSIWLLLIAGLILNVIASIPSWSWVIVLLWVAQVLLFALPGPLNVAYWPAALFAGELLLVWGSTVAVQVYRSSITRVTRTSRCRVRDLRQYLQQQTWWRRAGCVLAHRDLPGRPCLRHRVNDTPGLLCLIAANEQGRVAPNHREDEVGIWSPPRCRHVRLEFSVLGLTIRTIEGCCHANIRLGKP
jgi:hypothetical protein